MDGVRGCWRAFGRAIDGPLVKTQYLKASVAVQSSPRIFALSGARLRIPVDTRQLIDCPVEVSAISLQNIGIQCSDACMNAGKQLFRAWRNVSLLLFQMRTNVSTWLSRAWNNASALLSGTRMKVRDQYSRASKMSCVLISRSWAISREQSLLAWKRIRAQQIARYKCKRLQVAETVSLGEKRFVAVIKVDGREFLIGGGATNVALLAQLGVKKQLKSNKQLKAAESFDGILTKEMTVPKKQPAKRAKKKAAKLPAEKTEGQL
jgi:flagellar biogenesis protein FliO